MKKIQFKLYLVCATLLAGCSAKEPDPSPDVLYKIVEYQTNTPISGVKFELRYSEGGVGGGNIVSIVGPWYSDGNGEILISPDKIHGSYHDLFLGTTILLNYNDYQFTSFNKDKYWSYSGGLGTTKISLFPYSWIRIHIRNEIPLVITIHLHTTAINGGLKHDYFFRQSLNSIDTTVVYETYGNIDNTVEASISYDSAKTFQRVYSETKLVNKNDTIDYEIHIK